MPIDISIKGTNDIARFPDGTSDDVISRILTKEYPAPVPPAQGLFEQFGRSAATSFVQPFADILSNTDLLLGKNTISERLRGNLGLPFQEYLQSQRPRLPEDDPPLSEVFDEEGVFGVIGEAFEFDRLARGFGSAVGSVVLLGGAGAVAKGALRGLGLLSRGRAATGTLKVNREIDKLLKGRKSFTAVELGNARMQALTNVSKRVGRRQLATLAGIQGGMVEGLGAVEEARSQGADLNTRRGVFAAATVATGILETMGFTAILNALPTSFKTRLGNAILGAGAEGATEYLQNLAVGGVLEAAGLSGDIRNRMIDAIEEAIAGGMVGGILGAATREPVTTLQDPRIVPPEEILKLPEISEDLRNQIAEEFNLPNAGDDQVVKIYSFFAQTLATSNNIGVEDFLRSGLGLAKVVGDRSGGIALSQRDPIRNPPNDLGFRLKSLDVLGTEGVAKLPAEVTLKQVEQFLRPRIKPEELHSIDLEAAFGRARSLPIALVMDRILETSVLNSAQLQEVTQGTIHPAMENNMSRRLSDLGYTLSRDESIVSSGDNFLLTKNATGETRTLTDTARDILEKDLIIEGLSPKFLQSTQDRKNAVLDIIQVLKNTGGQQGVELTDTQIAPGPVEEFRNFILAGPLPGEPAHAFRLAADVTNQAVYVWARTSIRGVDGLRTLVVEEIQSDQLQHIRRLQKLKSELLSPEISEFEEANLLPSHQNQIMLKRLLSVIASDPSIEQLAIMNGAEKFANTEARGNVINYNDIIPGDLSKILKQAKLVNKKVGRGTFTTNASSNIKEIATIEGLSDDVDVDAAIESASDLILNADISDPRIANVSNELLTAVENMGTPSLDRFLTKVEDVGFNESEIKKFLDIAGLSDVTIQLTKHDKDAVRTYTLTEQDRQTVIDKGSLLFQAAATEQKGSITRFGSTEEGFFHIMKGFSSADSSTALHELAHFAAFTAAGDLKTAIEKAVHEAGYYKGKLRTREEWGGTELTTPTNASNRLEDEVAVDSKGRQLGSIHEMFARDFERYMIAGKAPTPSLNNIFSEIADRLKRIYQGISEMLRGSIHPSMSAIFDQLILNRPSPAAATLEMANFSSDMNREVEQAIAELSQPSLPDDEEAIRRARRMPIGTPSDFLERRDNEDIEDYGDRLLEFEAAFDAAFVELENLDTPTLSSVKELMKFQHPRGYKPRGLITGKEIQEAINTAENTFRFNPSPPRIEHLTISPDNSIFDASRDLSPRELRIVEILLADEPEFRNKPIELVYDEGQPLVVEGRERLEAKRRLGEDVELIIQDRPDNIELSQSFPSERGRVRGPDPNALLDDDGTKAVYRSMLEETEKQFASTDSETLDLALKLMEDQGQMEAMRRGEFSGIAANDRELLALGFMVARESRIKETILNSVLPPDKKELLLERFRSKYIDAFVNAETEAGRALRAVQVVKTYIDQLELLRELAPQLTDSELIKFAQMGSSVAKLDSILIDLARQAKKEGRKPTERARKEVGKAKTRSKSRLITSYFYNSILSGKALVVNTLSTMAWGQYLAADRALVGVLDRIHSRLTGGKPENFPTEGLALLKSQMLGLAGKGKFGNIDRGIPKKFKKPFLQAIKGEIDITEEDLRNPNNLFTPKDQEIQNIGHFFRDSLTDILGKEHEVAARRASHFFEMPTRIMQATDIFFKSLAEQGQREALAVKEEGFKRTHGDRWAIDYWAFLRNEQTRKATRNPVEVTKETNAEIARAQEQLELGNVDAANSIMTVVLQEYQQQLVISSSMRVAEHSTFQDKPGRFVKGIKDARNNTNIGPLPVGRLFIPFIDTIANITKRSGEFVPAIGIGFGRMSGLTGAEIVAKQIEGMMIVMMLSLYFDDDELVGEAPSSPAERDAWARIGRRPNSILVPGSELLTGQKQYADFRMIEPFGALLGMAAAWRKRMQEAERSQEDPTKQDISLMNALSRVGADAAKEIINVSFLDSPLQVLGDVAGDPGTGDFAKSLKRQLLRPVASFVPFSSFWRTMANAYEAQRTGGVEQLESRNWPELMGQTMPRGAPFGDRVTRLDAFGDTRQRYTGLFREWLSVTNRVEPIDRVEQELQRLGHYPGTPLPSGRVVIGNRVVALDVDDRVDAIYRDYLVGYGVAAKARLSVLYHSPVFSRLSRVDRRLVSERVLGRIQSVHLKRLKGRIVREGLHLDPLYSIAQRQQIALSANRGPALDTP